MGRLLELVSCVPLRPRCCRSNGPRRTV